MKDLLAVVFAFLLGLAAVVGLSALVGLLFMLLWNFVVPKLVPSAPQISFWVAWGGMFLLGMIRQALFGSR